MKSIEEGLYRIRLAEGFLDEARQDIALERWRSCMDNSQLAVENAAKSVLALVSPIGRTHNTAVLLREALKEGRISESLSADVSRIAECAELLGPDVHIESDYGDEAGGRTPWELFSEDDAKGALALAEDAVRLAAKLLSDRLEPPAEPEA